MSRTICISPVLRSLAWVAALTTRCPGVAEDQHAWVECPMAPPTRSASSLSALSQWKEFECKRVDEKVLITRKGPNERISGRHQRKFVR